MTQTHALFLEWFSLQQATLAGRYSLENSTSGARPHTPAPLEADCLEIHETAATLLATLGQPIFEPLINAPTSEGAQEWFYCKGSDADGVGAYTSEGFVVHKGSRGRAASVASIQGTANERLRQQLLTEGVVALQDGMLVFNRDHLFSSPSTAAMAVMGRSANGWVEWKAANGKTLHELKRTNVHASEQPILSPK